MYGVIDYSEIESGEIKGSTLFIDMRTEKEFSEATIPGAINIPIMNNEERVEIGTTYVAGDIKKAKEMGIDAASEKLPQIYRQIEGLYQEYDNVVLFCAKGGFRSKAIFYLLRGMSLNVYQLKGGYKGYRRHINQNLPELFKSVNYVVLHGNTGSGKTNILYELEKMGANVLDLEGCANHRGSKLGSIGLKAQNTQKMFESLIYHTLYGKEGQTFFTEGESKRIGRIIMQSYMYDTLAEGKIVLVEAPMEYRTKNIMNEYVDNNDEELIESIDLLEGLMSSENRDSLKERLANQEYESVVEDLMVKYYDSRYKIPKNYELKIVNNDEVKCAEELLKIYNK